MGLLLKWCDKCQEQSVITRVYENKDGQRNRLDFCINKGCKFKIKIPLKTVLATLIIFLSLTLFQPICSAHSSPYDYKEAKQIADIIYGEGANDAFGWTPRLNTYYASRRTGESLLDSLKRNSCAYRFKSKEYLKAKNETLNGFEQPIYDALLDTVNEFIPDENWQYIHHENIAGFYKSKEEAFTALRKAWGEDIDFKNAIKIGREHYFARKQK